MRITRALALSLLTVAVASANAGSDYLLNLDGTVARFVTDVDGGFLSRFTVDTTPPDTSLFRDRTAGDNPLYENASFRCQPGVEPMTLWLDDICLGRRPFRGGGLILHEQQGVTRKLGFQDGYLADVELPGCDRAKNEARTVKYAIKSDVWTLTDISGTQVSGQKQKQWMCNNFRMAIKEQGAPKGKLLNIQSSEPFLIHHTGKMLTGENRTAIGPEYECGNVRFHIKKRDAELILKWADEFSIPGLHTDRSIELIYDAPNSKAMMSVLLRCQLLRVSGPRIAVGDVSGDGMLDVVCCVRECKGIKQTMQTQV